MKFARVLLFIVALAVLGGCSSGTPFEPNVLRINAGAEVQALDPQIVTGVPEHRVMSALFDGLADLDLSSMEPVPATAESWTISEDGRVYTFTIRANARWSNGDPVTAQHFAYSWRRILSPALGAEYAGLLHCIENAKAFNEGTLADFAQVGVKALDDHTLVVTLDHPTPYFLSMQMHQAWYPVHPPTIEKFGAIDQRGTAWTRAENFVCNGEFRLTEWKPDEIIRVRKNEHYWNADAIRLAGIDFYPIDDLQTEERSFRAGVLHVTEDIPLHKIPVYQRENPDLLRLDPYLGTYYYRANITKAPLNDKRVRQALSLALDREEIARNVMKAGERPAFHYVPPGTAGYVSTSQVAFNVDKARQLLADAGYPEGKGLPPVEILYNTSENHKLIAEAIQRIWRENLNIQVRLLNQDWKVYLDSMMSLNYQLARSGWIGDVVDPVNFLECFISTNGNNRTGFASPEYDRLLAAAYAETGRDARYALLQQAEAMLLDESPVIPIYFYTRKFLMAKAVKGYIPNVLGYFQWRDLYLDE